TQSYAFTFDRGAKPIEQMAYVKSPAPDDNDLFGCSLSISGDLLAVGACGEASAAHAIDGDYTNNSAYNAGAVYIYRRDGAVWTYEAYIKPDNMDANDLFGTSVSLSGDTLAVGAPGEGSKSRAIDLGELDNSAAGAGA